MYGRFVRIDGHPVAGLNDLLGSKIIDLDLTVKKEETVAKHIVRSALPLRPLPGGYYGQTILFHATCPENVYTL